MVCGNEKAGAGVLSGMVFLLTRTTRTRQRWRDGEGALGSCLRRDVAAINKMHSRCERYRAATTPHKNKPNRVADRISIASPCPSLREPAGDAGRKPVDGARGCRFTQGKGWQCGRVRPCLCFTWPLGGWGALAGKRPPHKPRSDHNKTRHRPARPCCKRRRGDETPAPFCCPSTKEMDVDHDLCGGIYPKGARHKGLLCEPEGRELSGACALHKTPLC